MWFGQPKQASSATMSIVYITVGALMDVWTIIYYIYLNRHGADDTTFLWVYGFFFSGIVLMAIGFALGAIGRSAKQAEVAPTPQVVANSTPVGTAPPTQPIVVAVPSAPATPAPAAAPAPVPTHQATATGRARH